MTALPQNKDLFDLIHITGDNDLGTLSPKISYGLTLNYCTKTMFTLPSVKPVSGKPLCFQWGHLSPDQQHVIFLKDLRTIFGAMVDNIYATFEFTEKGNLHCHAILFIDDKESLSTYWLEILKAKITQHPILLRRSKGKYSALVTANYIHKLKKEGWAIYIHKDSDEVPFKPWTLKGQVPQRPSDLKA